MADIRGGTGVVFQEAIDALADRLALPPADWLALIREADRAAADRAAGMSDALVRDLVQAIKVAMEQGTTAATFRDTFDEITRRHGWGGGNEEGWRSNLTFRVMTAQAAAAGRWRQITRLAAHRPYLRYVTAGDARVRPAHAAWHGTILRWDDPWWDTHFPPNGFNCRCHVMSLSEDDLDRYGFKVSPAPPPAAREIRFVRVNGRVRPVETPKGIDPGFGFNPGKIGLYPAPPPSEQPVTVGRLPEMFVGLLGTSTDRVLLSEATIAKQAATHPDVRPADYARLQSILVAPRVAVRDGARAIVLLRDTDGIWWKASVKATEAGHELYLTSFHRIHVNQVNAIIRRGAIVIDERG